MDGLKEKVVIITGASGGIGAATAVEFAKCGAWLSLTGRNQERLQNTASQCYAQGIPKGKVLLTACDLGDTVKSCDFIIKETLDRFGKIDVLVNCAGIGLIKSLELTTPEDLDLGYKLLLKAPFFFSQKTLPHLKETKGCIINISSSLGETVLPSMFSYGVLKAGLNHFSRSLAAVASSSGVRVNTLCPGPVMTDMLKGAIPPELPAEAVPQVMAKMAELIPIGRISEPAEIAATVVFLASDKAKCVTGATWMQDGGFSIPQIKSEF